MTEDKHEIQPEVKLEAFRDAVFVFDKYVGDYWIDSGTLLGIVREDRFLPWESDIDMATWRGYINGKKRVRMLKEMKKKGFEGYFKKDKTTFRRQGVKIDFWFLDKTGDMATRTIFKPNSLFSRRLVKLSLIFGRMPSRLAGYIYSIISWFVQFSNCTKMKMMVPLKYLSSTKEHHFKGIKINIPENTEDYLAFRYGDSWRVPNDNWHSPTQDGIYQLAQKGIK